MVFKQQSPRSWQDVQTAAKSVPHQATRWVEGGGGKGSTEQGGQKQWCHSEGAKAGFQKKGNCGPGDQIACQVHEVDVQERCDHQSLIFRFEFN